MGRIFSLIFVLSLLFGVAACASESSLSEELPADSEGESCKSAIPQLSDSPVGAGRNAANNGERKRFRGETI